MTSTDPESDLIERIIEVLEAHGIGRYEYQLYDVVDPEALEKLVASGGEDVEVKIKIHGVTILLRGDGTLDVDDSDDA